MQIFRTYRVRATFIALISLSLMPFLFNQQNNAQKDDRIVNWLQSLMLEHSDEEISSQLASLSQTEKETTDFLKKASLIVSNHADFFNLPFDGENASNEEVFQILLHQWTEFQQNGSGMGTSAHLDRSSKNGFNIEKFYKAPSDISRNSTDVFYQIWSTSLDAIQFIRHTILPMIGGTAIGAP